MTGPRPPTEADVSAKTSQPRREVLATTAAQVAAVRMLHMNKRFGAVQANADVNLSVEAGTVHGIVGENGAGKSTLMSLLYGFYGADSGEIEVFGQPAQIRNAFDAIALGLGMVHQHFMLVESLSALHNVMLGAEPHFLLDRAERQLRQRLLALMQSTGLQVELDALVADLSVGDRQRLEILKALVRGAKVLILDEPTAVLTPQETEQLFGVLAQLRAQGTTIILITHKLREVMRLCDHVTVMRAGRVVHETAIADTSVEQLAEAMVGRQVHLGRQARPSGEVAAAGRPLLQARGLEVRDNTKLARLNDVNLSLHGGEIVGVAGVSGNGQSELLDVLAGLRTPERGELDLNGEHFDAGHWLEPRQARRLGLAHVPEDRHARALVMDFAAWEAAVLGYEDAPRYQRLGWLRHKAMREATAQMMERFDVRPRNPELACANFSGGNQQKLVLARELGQGPRVLLVGQPTRGVDIGAIEFIHARLRELRDAGCAVLLVSSELDEILALSDRVVVMYQGRLCADLPVQDCHEAELGMLMACGTQS
jgi:general nucleoside transport system ATP-binding protein